MEAHGGEGIERTGARSVALARWLASGLAISGAALGLGVAPAYGDGDHGAHHGTTASSAPEPQAPRPGRQLCSYRPGKMRPQGCGTKAEMRPAPPLRGTMLMFEANSFTGLEPTEPQQKAADDMIAACEASRKKHGWDDIDNALAEGYTLAWNDPVHYVNRDYVFDDAMLECDKPEYLMYYDSPDGKILAGVMFITQGLLDEGPQLGGPLTRWHYHYWVKARCLDDGVLAIGLAKLGECEEGEMSFRSPEMLHVWFFDHPGGRFSSMMHLSDETRKKMIREKGEASTP